MTPEEALAALQDGEKERAEAKGVRRVIERVPWHYRLAQWDCLSGANEGMNAAILRAREWWLEPDGTARPGRAWYGSDEPPTPRGITTKYLPHAGGVDVIEGGK